MTRPHANHGRRECASPGPAAVTLVSASMASANPLGGERAGSVPEARNSAPGAQPKKARNPSGFPALDVELPFACDDAQLIQQHTAETVKALGRIR